MSSFFDTPFVSDETQAQSEFTPIPEGEYNLVIEKAETKPTKAGTGERLNIQFKVDGGDFDGRKLFHGLNVRNPSTQAVAIAMKELHALVILCGIKELVTADQLVGQSLTVKVKVGKRADTGALQNEVVLAVRKSDTTVKPTNTTPSTQQPSASAKPKTAGNGTWD
jgi:hypothetical protein